MESISVEKNLFFWPDNKFLCSFSILAVTTISSEPRVGEPTLTGGNNGQKMRKNKQQNLKRCILHSHLATTGKLDKKVTKSSMACPVTSVSENT